MMSDSERKIKCTSAPHFPSHLPNLKVTSLLEFLIKTFCKHSFKFYCKNSLNRFWYKAVMRWKEWLRKKLMSMCNIIIGIGINSLTNIYWNFHQQENIYLKKRICLFKPLLLLSLSIKLINKFIQKINSYFKFNSGWGKS